MTKDGVALQEHVSLNQISVEEINKNSKLPVSRKLFSSIDVYITISHGQYVSTFTHSYSMGTYVPNL